MIFKRPEEVQVPCGKTIQQTHGAVESCTQERLCTNCRYVEYLEGIIDSIEVETEADNQTEMSPEIQKQHEELQASYEQWKIDHKACPGCGTEENYSITLLAATQELGKPYKDEVNYFKCVCGKQGKIEQLVPAGKKQEISTAPKLELLTGGK